MENSLSNINSNSNSWKIALAIAIPIAIVPKKAIAIAVSILLLMSGTRIGNIPSWKDFVEGKDVERRGVSLPQAVIQKYDLMHHKSCFTHTDKNAHSTTAFLQAK